MLCPKCYGKVNKNTNRCDYCGMRMSDLEGATNAQAKIALKSIYKDDVMYVEKLPKDVSKKKLLLLSIFAGVFGAHDFYVGRLWRGLYKVFTLAFLVCLIVIHGGSKNNIYFAIAQILQGISFVICLLDILYISIGKYKVPVYKTLFSKGKSQDTGIYI